jgi:hypothetical protein
LDFDEMTAELRLCRCFFADIFWGGGGVFLRGFLQKTWCRGWFFDGEFVVERW